MTSLPHALFASLELSNGLTSGIFLDEAIPPYLSLPALSDLKIGLCDTADHQSMHNPATFNPLRFPKLTSIALNGMGMGAQSFTQISDALFSMTRLHTLLLLSCPLLMSCPFFLGQLNGRFFPHLKVFIISSTRFTPNTWPAVHSNRPICVLLSLQTIHVSFCTGSALPDVVVYLLSALHSRFGENYSKGMLHFWSHLSSGYSGRPTRASLPEHLAKRLIVDGTRIVVPGDQGSDVAQQ